MRENGDAFKHPLVQNDDRMNYEQMNNETITAKLWHYYGSFAQSILPLHSAGLVATGRPTHLHSRVVIAHNGLLETGSGYGKFQSVGIRFPASSP